jgi:hypothetical protein
MVPKMLIGSPAVDWLMLIKGKFKTIAVLMHLAISTQPAAGMIIKQNFTI